jgi:hypothetical protein
MGERHVRRTAGGARTRRLGLCSLVAPSRGGVEPRGGRARARAVRQAMAAERRDGRIVIARPILSRGANTLALKRARAAPPDRVDRLRSTPRIHKEIRAALGCAGAAPPDGWVQGCASTSLTSAKGDACSAAFVRTRLGLGGGRVCAGLAHVVCGTGVLRQGQGAGVRAGASATCESRPYECEDDRRAPHHPNGNRLPRRPGTQRALHALHALHWHERRATPLAAEC